MGHTTDASGRHIVPLQTRLEIRYGAATENIRNSYDPNNEGLIIRVETINRGYLYNRILGNDEFKEEYNDFICYPLYRSFVLDEEEILGDENDPDAEYPLAGIFGFAAIDNNNHNARFNFFCLFAIADHNGQLNIHEDGALRWLPIREYGNPHDVIQFIEANHQIPLLPESLD